LQQCTCCQYKCANIIYQLLFQNHLPIIIPESFFEEWIFGKYYRIQINLTTHRLLVACWTMRTPDRGLAAHYEHTLMITRGEPMLLTAA